MNRKIKNEAVEEMFEMKLEKPMIYFLSGRTGGGKSHLIKWILYNGHELFDWILMVSPSAFEDAPYIAKEKTVEKITDEDIIDILEKQKKEFIEDGSSSKGLLVIDDCLGSLNFNSAAFKRLFTTYRHYNLSIIIATQRANQIPTTVRDVANYAVILRPTSVNVIDVLYESFNTHFPNKKTFKEFVMKNTEDFQALVISRVGNGEIFTIKAPEKILDFKI